MCGLTSRPLPKVRVLGTPRSVPKALFNSVLLETVERAQVCGYWEPASIQHEIKQEDFFSTRSSFSYCLGN